MISSGPTAAVAPSAATALPCAASGAGTAAAMPADFLAVLLAVQGPPPSPVGANSTSPLANDTDHSSSPADTKKPAPVTAVAAAAAVPLHAISIPLAAKAPSTTPVQTPVQTAVPLQSIGAPAVVATAAPAITSHAGSTPADHTSTGGFNPGEPADALARAKGEPTLGVGSPLARASASAGSPAIEPPVVADITPVRAQPEPVAAAIPTQPIVAPAAPPSTPQTAKVPANTVEHDSSAGTAPTVAASQHATALPPALAVTAAPPVAHRPSDEPPYPPDRAIADVLTGTATASHRVPIAPSAESTPRPSEHAAANVQVILDGVRGRLEELRQNGQTVMHLQLSPPELGHVRMQLVAHDQQVDVRLVVQNDAARHVLATQAETLRDRLGTLGVALGRFDVRQDGGSPAQQDQPAPEHVPTPVAGSKRGGARPAGARRLTGINVIA